MSKRQQAVRRDHMGDEASESHQAERERVGQGVGARWAR